MASIKNPGVKPVEPVVAVDIEKVRYCETGKDDSVVEFVRCFRYEDGVLVGFTDYEVDGSTPYTVVDAENVAECEPLAAADVEQKLLCDRQPTGEKTTFQRHTVYNPDGTVASEYDTTLDGTVAYTVVGKVGPCDEVCSTVALYNESREVTDGAPVGIDPSIVGSYGVATCAKIQVLGGPVYFTVNDQGEPSGDPSELVGCRVDDCGVIEIGCCPGNVGSAAELTHFQVVAAQGETAQIQVVYYAEEL